MALAKRNRDANEFPLELPNKKIQVSMLGGTSSCILMEAIEQPCQEQ